MAGLTAASATMTDPVTAAMIIDVRSAVKESSERGLIAASKWATDILLSIAGPRKRQLKAEVPLEPQALFAPTQAAEPSTSPTDDSFTLDHLPSPDAPTTVNPAMMDQMQSTTPGAPVSRFHQLEDMSKHILNTDEATYEVRRIRSEHDLVVGAKAYFDAREFNRVSYMLQGCVSAKAIFLSCYSLFLASEKQAMHNWHKQDGNRTQPPAPINPALSGLLDKVKSAKDPWLLFLSALFLSRLGRREEAIEACLLSIAKVQWNWSTWLLLGSCIHDGEELSSLLTMLPVPPTHPVAQLFVVKVMNDLQIAAENELSICDRLLSEGYFSHSMWLMSYRAACLYHLHEYDQAEHQFDAILRMDPFRVDDIDILSNILFVQENRLKLSKLAHEFLAVNRDRPEVCLLVGNHYSLRGEHEKAVKYFKRATELDRTYLTAWTLMGHEYVEMKNSHAAIEAYRRAVDINRKDYRAWYGLGQAYELLSMHNYALYYYQHSTALRSYDVRLWQAQGSCYEELARPREAIECYKRALISSDVNESVLCLKLARLHLMLDEKAEAAAYHRRVVEYCQDKNRPIAEYAKSCLEVAEYNITLQHGNLGLAKSLLDKVAASNSEEVVRATDMLKRLREREMESMLNL